MSTRSTTHFVESAGAKPTAIIYRHSDGYPEGAGADLAKFLTRVSKLRDKRFSDPSYLAAKYVVFLAEMFHKYEKANGSTDPMEFISVGVLDRDPGDIEYRYVVISNGNTRPTVQVYEVSGDANDATLLGTIEADGSLKDAPAPS